MAPSGFGALLKIIRKVSDGRGHSFRRIARHFLKLTYNRHLLDELSEITQLIKGGQVQESRPPDPSSSSFCAQRHSPPPVFHIEIKGEDYACHS
ncbi:Hypothetical predicted protein [Marmota monax]|uniref:Uncharacterized protein n=1 Tax=Marmota monax TaxID=9995 RepID=A0A5E4AVY1_MARMO|nr:hypothetical protein GHT09_002237 [Marmota monax]VTJ61558.1 Hypothetical predicted protein [Marmota monax]